MSDQNKQVAKKTTIQEVVEKVSDLESQKLIKFPVNYDPYGAIYQAQFILSQLKDKNKNFVLDSCTPQSITNSLMEMVTKGLNPAKNQCHFIPYGNSLTLHIPYEGKVLMARREGLKQWPAVVVWKGEEFDLGTDPETGEYVINSHKPDISKWTNNIDDIVAAYCTLTFQDGTKHTEIMTIDQIKAAWGMGRGMTDTHKKFPDQMAKKTVISRAVKPYVESSNDEAFFQSESTGDVNQGAFESQENAPETELDPGQPEADPETGEVVNNQGEPNF